MFRRTVSAVIIAMLLTGIITVASNVQPVNSDYAWTETIYLQADGSLQPPTAPISSVDNVTYTLTDSITGNVPVDSSAIIIQRDNIIIDGAGHMLRGTQASNSTGIELTERSNVTIKNMKITAFDWGIYLYSSSNNSASGNNITNNGVGIELDYSSSDNSVSGNNITNNKYDGIGAFSSNNNSISGNNITANERMGIDLALSSNNSVSGNSLVNDGLYVQFSYGTLVTGNLVNGKPLVYLENVSDYKVGDAGQVILVECNNVTVQNLNLSNTTTGVELWETNNTAISGNNMTANNWDGIELNYSYNNSISGNNIAASNWYGIFLGTDADSNSLSGNSLVNDGLVLSYSFGNVVTGNLVNGKPLVYLEGVSDYKVGDAGQVVLVRCNNVTVENLNLSNASIGVYLYATNNTTIRRNNITSNSWQGIHTISPSYNNSVSGNNIAANRWWGISLDSYNSVSGNNITNNYYGLSLGSYNSVNGNNITNNHYGIRYSYSGNIFYHNNFMNNTRQVYSFDPTNVWDDGYPSGGNFWSDHAGVDSYSGSYQNQTGSDGIGDTSYIIDSTHADGYPLMGPFSSLCSNATQASVQCVSNSTVSGFQLDETTNTISFNVTGPPSTTGFCTLTIPHSTLPPPYILTIDDNPIQYTIIFANDTISIIYFAYLHSTHEVTIATSVGSSGGGLGSGGLAYMK